MIRKVRLMLVRGKVMSIEVVSTRHCFLFFFGQKCWPALELPILLWTLHYSLLAHDDMVYHRFHDLFYRQSAWQVYHDEMRWVSHCSGHQRVDNLTMERLGRNLSWTTSQLLRCCSHHTDRAGMVANTCDVHPSANLSGPRNVSNSI